MDEFIRNSPIAFWSGVLGLLFLILIVWARPWRWPAMWRAESGPATREIARAHGIRVEDVQRVVPFLDDPKVRFERETVVRYSIARPPGATPPRWSFVLRTMKLGAQYPHGWVFRAEAASPPALHKVLKRIARENFEEFLEFEADESEVHAFWHEGGGAEGVGEIERYLRALATSAGGDAALAAGSPPHTPAPQSPSAAEEETASADRLGPRFSARSSGRVRLAVTAAWIGWILIYVKYLLPAVEAFLARYFPRPVALILALVLVIAVPTAIEKVWTAAAGHRRKDGVHPR